MDAKESHIQESKSTSESEDEDEHDEPANSQTVVLLREPTSNISDLNTHTTKMSNVSVKQQSENEEESKSSINPQESTTLIEVNIPAKAATTSTTSSSVSARVLRRLPDNRISFFMQLQRDEQVRPRYVVLRRII